MNMGDVMMLGRGRCREGPPLAALDAVITEQAQIIAYIDDYKLLMIATLAVIPLLQVFRKASAGGADDTLVIE